MVYSKSPDLWILLHFLKHMYTHTHTHLCYIPRSRSRWELVLWRYGGTTPSHTLSIHPASAHTHVQQPTRPKTKGKEKALCKVEKCSAQPWGTCTTAWATVNLQYQLLLLQFPYAAPPPQEPVKTLRSLINIRKDTLRLVRLVFCFIEISYCQ